MKKNANVNAKARCGATALHFASETGKLGVVKILIEQGHADINIANEHGVTALLAAADRQGIKQHLYKKINFIKMKVSYFYDEDYS